MAGPARVTLYTRPGCHLCGPARETVALVCREVGVQYDEVDITGADSLVQRYGHMIPVVCVDGVVVDYWRVDAARLAAHLAPQH